MPTRDLVTVAEAAEMLGVSPPRIYQFISDGRLDPIKPQRDVFLDKTQVETFAKHERPTGRPRKAQSHGQ